MLELRSATYRHRIRRGTWMQPWATIPGPGIRGVTLQIHPGKIVGLVGPNGAGKTTLMQILSGLLNLEDGQIILDDNSFESQKRWQESSIHLIQDEAQEKIVKGHVKTAEFYNSFRVPNNLVSGNHSIKGELLYKACNNSLCTLPQSLSFESQVRVGIAK